MNRACVLLARAPSAPGKTRLTAGLDADAAHALRRALLLDTFEIVASAGAPVIVSFTPTTARSEIESLCTAGPGPFPVSAIPQRENCDLGQRMYGALMTAQEMGAAHTILVGADLATLPVAHLHAAFAQLESGCDVVLGPADDGGYYLVGVNGPVMAAAKRLFHEIAWSTEVVLAQTLAAAAAAGLRTALIAPWFDVDTRDDLSRIRTDPRPDAARHTRAWATRYLRTG